MAAHQIELDTETDRILRDLAQDYDGDVSMVIVDLIRQRRVTEEDLDQIEDEHQDLLRKQLEAGERAFAEGRAITLGELKRRSGL